MMNQSARPAPMAPAGVSPRQRVLLSFLDGEGDCRLDPIRIMKGLFLFAKEAPQGWVDDDARYSFEPYSYGPFSSDVYTDLRALSNLGYVTADVVHGATWRQYGLSDEGRKAAKASRVSLDPNATEYLDQIRNFVVKLGFRSLLSAIYKKYPDYAVNSVFKT